MATVNMIANLGVPGQRKQGNRERDRRGGINEGRGKYMVGMSGG